MRSLRSRLVVLLAVLAMVLPAGALARTRYFCSMMGRSVPSCCCAASHRTKSPSRGTELRARDCCERITPGAGHEAVQSGAEATPPVPPAALAATLPAFISAPPPASRSATAETRARGPPGLGPPLYIAHCSLLS